MKNVGHDVHDKNVNPFETKNRNKNVKNDAYIWDLETFTADAEKTVRDERKVHRTNLIEHKISYNHVTNGIFYLQFLGWESGMKKRPPNHSE